MDITKQLIRMLMVVLALSVTIGAVAKAEKKILRYPIGCNPVGYKFDLYNVVFQPPEKHNSQTIYFVHNTSMQRVRMFHAMTGERSYIVHINESILPNRWAVLALDMHDSKYICAHAEYGSDKLDIVKCADVLDVCEYDRSRFGGNHRGNYWMVHNNTRNGAVRAARRHGVLLVDPYKQERIRGR